METWRLVGLGLGTAWWVKSSEQSLSWAQGERRLEGPGKEDFGGAQIKES